jgi:hypothetical protein
MAKNFEFDPTTSDLVTFVRLRRATYLEKGRAAWAGWVDGDAVQGFSACGCSSTTAVSEPSKVVVKDGFLPCDTQEEAEAVVAKNVAAKLAEGFTRAALTTSGEPEEFLARIAKSPADASLIAVTMSARFLESKKAFVVFWPEGASVAVREGKAGTFSLETFAPDDDEASYRAPTPKERVALMSRLIEKKVAAGFVEKALPSAAPAPVKTPPHVAAWEALVAAKDRAKAVAAHLAFLGESPQDKKLLSALAEQVTSMSVEGGALSITFGTGKPAWKLRANAPWDKAFDKSVPASYRRFAEVHNGAQLLHGNRVTLAFRGVSGGRLPRPEVEADWLESADEGLFAKFEAKDLPVNDVLARHDDYLIANPFKKTKAKEPQLLFLAHEGGEPQTVFGGEVGVPGAFLRFLAEDVLDHAT